MMKGERERKCLPVRKGWAGLGWAGGEVGPQKNWSRDSRYPTPGEVPFYRRTAALQYLQYLGTYRPYLNLPTHGPPGMLWEGCWPLFAARHCVIDAWAGTVQYSLHRPMCGADATRALGTLCLP